MKYYHIVDDGIHEIIKFDNDGRVFAAFPIGQLDSSVDSKENLQSFDIAMVELEDDIKYVVSSGKVLYEFWCAGLKAEEEKYLEGLSTDYDNVEDFIEAYLSSGYEYWTDTYPEKDTNNNRFDQDVYEYLKMIWNKANG